MSATLVRLRCYMCDHAVITPNEYPPVTAHRLMVAHFVESKHFGMRPMTPDDLMQPYFVIPEQSARYSDSGTEK